MKKDCQVNPKDNTTSLAIHEIYKSYSSGDYKSFEEATTQLADLLDKDRDRLIFQLLCVLNDENKRLIAGENNGK